MAKLVIKKREDAKETNGISLRDYDVTIDGNEISHMTGLSLNMGVDEFNQCILSFYVDSVEVDADFLAAVEANVTDEKFTNELKPVTDEGKQVTAESYTIRDNKVYLDGKEVE